MTLRLPWGRGHIKARMLLEPSLPIDECLPALRQALGAGNRAVLVAPPGAGKTTRAPLALAQEAWALDKRLLVLSPRRIAARAAAHRMAASLGETVGETVGYRLRMESRLGPATRIEVLTEGIFTRMILADPGLEGVACVLFDEFHERSLEADLGLALALDAQAGLREDLRIVVMSATIDGARVAGLMDDAPVVESQGRLHPVSLRYCGRDPRRPVEEQTAEAIQRALASETGSILAFLPGAREIERTCRLLEGRVGPDVDLRPLYGALSPQEQDAAIAPGPRDRRKVVLASSIAETSLTIEGVRVVVDSGWSRRPRYEPGQGIASLETVRASKAAADQRAGRAGRLEPGVCLRLWDEAETRSLPPFDAPEILGADLAPLALALAEWGVREPKQLRWLDPPPAAQWAAALQTLRELGAADDAGAITDHGRRIARLALPPALAHMVLSAGAIGAARLAAELAVLISEPGLCGRDVDLRQRLERLRREQGRAHAARGLAQRLLRQAGLEAGSTAEPDAAGLVLARAFPGRIAKARREESGEYLLASGRGAQVDRTEPLARSRFLVAADLAGRAEQARILAAAPIAEADLIAHFAEHIETEETAALDPIEGVVRARRRRRLGKIVLQDQPLERPSPALVAQAWRARVRKLGLSALPGAAAIRQLQARAALLRALEPEEAWPDWSETALCDSVDTWLTPELAASLGLEGFADAWRDSLEAQLDWSQALRLRQSAPERFESPAGGSAPIDYTDPAGPAVEVRVQEVFGLQQHPTIADGRVRLVLKLLSPARRPVQTTTDLPGFWAGSYAQVRSELRGRYPKHPWPEDPARAEPTRKAKPRVG